jgi:hypothetical protein
MADDFNQRFCVWGGRSPARTSCRLGESIGPNLPGPPITFLSRLLAANRGKSRLLAVKNPNRQGLGPPILLSFAAPVFQSFTPAGSA